MKLAIVSESPSDEAAIKLLVEAVLETAVEVVSARLRPNGWPQVLQDLPAIVRAHYYSFTADALVVVADSDDSPIHQQLAVSSICNPDCRMCQLRTCLADTLTNVTRVSGRDDLELAVGLAVPAIEAWYLCGIDSHVNENTWGRGLLGEKLTYDRKSLKVNVYGTDQPGLQLSIEKAEEAARRLVESLELFEQLFPIGFGCLLVDLRSWNSASN